MEKEYFDLTAPQKSIWLTEQYYSNTNINNVCGTFYSSEKLDFELLKKSLNIFLKNNDSFKIKLCFTNDEIKQYFSEIEDIDFEIIDIKNKDEQTALENKVASKVFDLIDSFLFEIVLFRYPDNSGGFVINSHHIIADSWSNSLVANEVALIYDKVKNNKPYEKSKELSYKAYLDAEKNYLNSSKFEKDKQYWEEVFSTVPEVATIPSIKNNEKDDVLTANRLLLNVDSKLLSTIQSYCEKNKISLFNFFMAIFALYLGRVSNLNEFVIGTPILNRTNFKEKQTTGMFINTLPLKINLVHDKTFIENLKDISINSMALLRHQKYSYQYIIEDLRKKDSNLPMLYNILYSYQITKMNENMDALDHTTSWTFNKTISDALDIHMFEWNESNTINIAYDYRTSKYDEQDILDLHARILHIIKQVLENETILLKDIEIVTPEEKHKILYEFNNTKVDYPKDKTIVDLFEEQVEITPDNIAVVFEDQQLTYRELNEKANSLANYLIGKNIGRNDIIAIMVNRSLEMFIAILAVLKSGACYVPIDPEYPQDRIEYMLNNSNSKVLLTFNKLKNKVNFNNKIFVELDNPIYSNNKDNLKIMSKPDDLAYIIYTSGSTGTPKGVMISHKNVNNFIQGITNVIDFSSNKTIVSVTTISFDIFVLESLLPLQKGLKIIIANEKEQTDVKSFNKLCTKHNVNIIQTTPSRFQLLILDSNELEYIKNITDFLIGGESLSKTLLNNLKSLSNANIYNVYGPTETTVWSTIKNMTHANQITIGKPIVNTSCYILDNFYNLLPLYTPGTLYIGGTGVSKGYLNNHNLTETKFVYNPYNHDIMYNTGDLAYYTKNGELIHLGRNDFQVKINGHRIELEEIENEILKNEDIINCVVTKKTHENHHDFLCAYFTSSKDVNLKNLRYALNSKLPKYMIPQYFIKLDELPYTPNGKINRKILPTPNIETKNNKIILPRNITDEKLINILKDLLNIPHISIDDSFFELGGDSLSAINLCSKIYSNFNVQIFAKDVLENPIIRNLSDFIASKNTNNNHISIPKAEKSLYYPVSSAQRRVYYSTKLDGNNSILYNLPNILIFDQKPNIEKLKNCFHMLVQRHSSLRTSFEIIDNDVKQKISDNVSLNIETQNCTNDDIDNILKSFVKPFDLSIAPLMRCKIVSLPDKILLLFDIHHIIADGASLSILINDLCKLYNEETLPELQIEYKDYAVWESAKLHSSYFKSAEDYWLNQFKDEMPVLNLPTKATRPAVISYDGDKIYSKIDNSTFRKTIDLATKLNVTPYMILLSIYYILLSRYTGQSDIVVGTPIANRNFDELNNIIGMFVNSLPIRININQNITFRHFLEIVKNKCLESYKYENYPFDELINKLNINRDVSRSPLFDTMFIYQSHGNVPISFDGISSKYYIPNSKISKFDISLEIIPKDNEFDISIEYATKLFDKSFIEALLNHYINILNEVLDNLDIKISNIQMLSNLEKHSILYDFNNTSTSYSKNKTITTLFEEQVKKSPNEIAIVFGDQKLTFNELNEKSNSLAYYLRNEIKMRRNDIVGIMLTRSIEVIIAMLAVIKSGASYIPIDPSFPKDRIDYMLNSSNAKILLTQTKLENNINYNSKLSIDLNNEYIYNLPNKNLECINNSNDLVYIIFTSGSTGKPKGVMITHKVLSNFTNYCNDNVKYLKNPEHKNIISITTISFDIFVYETLISLQKGVKVIIANENEQTTPNLLNEIMIKNNVNILQSTPSVIQILLNNSNDIPALKNLEYVILAGEQLPLQLVNSLHKIANIVVYNGYGPSETYYSTLTEVNDKIVTIGKPISNSQMYILDKNMNPTPIGVIGDIYISGECVGNGYLNNLELTKKSFIQNPFLPNMIMYRSGDLGKYLPDGNIVCLGRSDHQVKIRGLRIELEEIEALILKYPNISKASVIKQTAKNREFISAYYVANKRISANALRKYLSKYLPKYMVPSYYTPLDDLPYTPNGKVDKKALPLPSAISNANEENYVAPTTDLQRQLVKIWENLLNVQSIGINDNFFELGGDSLLAMSLNLEISKLSDKVTYQDIFHFPTVCELAKIIESDEKISLFEKIENLPVTTMNILKHTTKKQKTKEYKLKNVLLTGSTGFLGIHILNELLNIEDTKIYCIIRDEPGLTAKHKLIQKLNFYFGEKYNHLIDKRIFIITGDICKRDFGLTQNTLTKLIASIDIIINSAANVAHFGDYNNFYKTNVLSVKYMIDFCKKHNKKLYHISTMGVAGLSLDSSYPSNKRKNYVNFDESSLYIGQNPETVYTYTKFKAELEILKEINNGLNAYILRLGNLMPRISDGIFQDNVTENEFINKIASFLRIGIIPQSLMSYSMEFTPVDCAAVAICKIITHPTDQNRVFHIFDHKRVPVSKCIKMLKKSKYELEILEEKNFVDKIASILEDNQSKKMLEFILDDFDENKHVSYEANMNVKSNFTRKYLKKLGFVWPKISTKYLKKFIKILRKVI